MAQSLREVTIIDYGAGNLRSVANAVACLGYRPVVTGQAEEVLASRAVILPGVGAAADTMRGLAKSGMDEVVRSLFRENRPLFCVCVGMQVLFSATEEGGWNACLGLIPGTVKRLPPGEKIPHMGWNQVRQRLAHPIFDGIPDAANFYFVHSYYPEPDDGSLAAGTTDYTTTFCSIIAQGNLVATQFHPEKSGRFGLQILENFLAWDGSDAE